MKKLSVLLTMLLCAACSQEKSETPAASAPVAASAEAKAPLVLTVQDEAQKLYDLMAKFDREEDEQPEIPEDVSDASAAQMVNGQVKLLRQHVAELKKLNLLNQPIIDVSEKLIKAYEVDAKIAEENAAFIANPEAALAESDLPDVDTEQMINDARNELVQMLPVGASEPASAPQ
ncbi:hypothetical protein [Kingella negevensis]|uniref:hypothetical protein n=1 Tax=Kingella negevensis TaxID=1522312 RepID=UPI00050A25F9|nr:hypothetical protein [Kingella negevensis]MDK4689124.1 hypothetical protein [Kingella negevensis]WII90706.1 hypothetical protein QEO93_09850 [Kingella negevensis]